MAAIYSDLNSTNPLLKPLVKDVESIYQSLFNIFNTVPGERLFLPMFGLDLEESLFEVIDDATSLDIYRRILNVVSMYEKRVQIDNTRTQIIPEPDTNSYYVDIYFSIDGMGDETFRYRGRFTGGNV